MTTAAEIKLLVKPLLEKHSDLALTKRLVVVAPVRHVFNAVLLDRKLDPDGLRVRWFVNSFFGLGGRLHIAWGEDIDHPKYGFWLKSQPSVQDLLIREIEQQALPRMRSIRDLAAFAEYVSQSPFRHHLFEQPLHQFVLLVALGRLEDARNLLPKVAERSLSEPHLDDEDRAHMTKVKLLAGLLVSDNIQHMARHLHDWEAETVRVNGLEHVWEPSPFPLEH